MYKLLVYGFYMDSKSDELDIVDFRMDHVLSILIN